MSSSDLRQQQSKTRTYSVDITETLKRTVKVKATSADEAKELVEDSWKDEAYVLGAKDFKDVHFIVAEYRGRDLGCDR